MLIGSEAELDERQPSHVVDLAGKMERRGYRVEIAASLQELEESATRQSFDAVVVPLQRDPARSLDCVVKLGDRSPGMRCIVLVSPGLDSFGLEAARLGALALPGDVTPDELDRVLQRFRAASSEPEGTPARRARSPQDGPLATPERLAARRTLAATEAASALVSREHPQIIGSHPELREPLRVIERVAPTHATVLITGESGTGKGLVASTLHAWSRRADRPFVTLNCAALAPSLLESELFGHERGAFTGALSRRPGRFEQAHTGTLYLDEVSEIPPETQVKLLRFLQERAFERVGGNETLVVDVRLVAATNRDLRKAVETGRFREDLFYRLKVICVELPPLRARRSDIPKLAQRFIERFAAEYDRPARELAPQTLQRMLRFDWPGNVRELEHAIEHAVVMSMGPIIQPEHLPESVTGLRCGRRRLEDEIRIPGSTLADIERTVILRAVEASGGNTLSAAESLGISQRKIQYRLRAYGASQGARSRSSGPQEA